VHTTRSVKVLAAWLLGLMLVGAAFMGTVTVLNSSRYAPEHQVGLYLDALRAGDGGTALGLLNASVPSGADPTLLDGDALRRSTAAVQEVRIGDARETGADRVEVPVTYALDGAQATTVFELERVRRTWGFFDVWRFEEGVLPAVELSAPDTVQAAVNGTDVGLPEGRARLASFYPASITAGYQGRYFAAPEQRIGIVDGSTPPPPIGLATEATPELAAAVEDRVREFLDSCAEQSVFQPAGCPFAYPTNERLAGDLEWSITEYPSVSISPDDGGWALAPLQGTAQIDTLLLDFFSGAVRQVSEPVPFEFDAGLTVSGDSITVTPVVRY
jgi:hypothetical protein